MIRTPASPVDVLGFSPCFAFKSMSCWVSSGRTGDGSGLRVSASPEEVLTGLKAIGLSSPFPSYCGHWEHEAEVVRLCLSASLCFCLWNQMTKDVKWRGFLILYKKEHKTKEAFLKFNNQNNIAWMFPRQNNIKESHLFLPEFLRNETNHVTARALLICIPIARKFYHYKFTMEEDTTNMSFFFFRHCLWKLKCHIYMLIFKCTYYMLTYFHVCVWIYLHKLHTFMHMKTHKHKIHYTCYTHTYTLSLSNAHIEKSCEL